MTNELNLLDNRAPVTGGKNGKRMRSNLSLKGLGWILAAGVIAAVASPASAQTLTTLASFAGYSTDTLGPLVADANGNLFGTRTWDGPLGYGTVFEIVKAAGGYAATPTILFSFDGTHGAYPHASLVADASGSLFGTTTEGGPSDMGTIFEIVKTAGGYAGVPTILASFDDHTGVGPVAGLMADANGNLFGTTTWGGPLGHGTVFEMVKTAGGYATPTVLASFDGTHALNPFGSLIADADGNLFGTTREGGSFGLGTVFEIVKTAAGYAGTPVILLSFDGVNGATPFAGLIADANGNLFGTTWDGGYIGGQCASCGYGTVFEIAKTAGGYASTQTVLVRFDWTHGGNSRAGLIADANGNLFGTAEAGGSYYGGTIFEIVKTAGGYASTPTVLYNFDDHTGVGPVGALIADANGNLFGTTRFSGPNGAGTVFELSGSGFVPPLRFAGVPGTANCIGVSTSTLTRTYGGISAGGKALGFASVAALQSAIAAFCGN